MSVRKIVNERVVNWGDLVAVVQVAAAAAVVVSVSEGKVRWGGETIRKSIYYLVSCNVCSNKSL